MSRQSSTISLFITLLVLSCSDAGVEPGPGSRPKDHAQTVRAIVDRFSDAAGVLFVRDGSNGMPGPNVPIDLDVPPFVTRGLGPAGQKVRYYNLDVQPTVPKPVYTFRYMNGGTAVPGQLNIIELIPGDAGYTDFWQVFEVLVPDAYVANTITSERGIIEAGFTVVPVSAIVNCPVVPEGSTASMRYGGGGSALHRGWYRDQAVFYFTFEERILEPVGGSVPVSPIYVAFNVNPGLPGGGPPSGFRTETGTDQSHNVVATLPESPGYSPLWQVNIYDNAHFDAVMDLPTAQSATTIAANAALVNCPIVRVE